MSKKPAEMARKSFAEKLREAIASRKYEDCDGPQKAAAREAGVSPDVLSDMFSGVFPHRRVRGLKPAHRKKVERGAISTLVRVCDTFELDVDAALQIFKLPKDEILIEKVRWEAQKRGRDIFLSDLDLEMLKRQVELIGPVPLRLVSGLVRTFRSRKS